MMLMMGFGLIVLVLLIGGVANGFGWRSQPSQVPPAPLSQAPLEILKARYARGEIVREQYDEMRRTLES